MIIDTPKREQETALRALWKEAFGDTDRFLELFWQTAFSKSRCRCVTEGEEITAALYWFDCLYHGQKIAYLYAVATAKAHQGRGLCRRLMEDSHAHLASLGYTGAILVPGSQGLFDLYARLGYSTCCEIRTIDATPSPKAIPLRSVSVEEYATLRRSLLPEGGVIQEGENLSFLSAQADLFAGEGFVLAARQERNRLWGLELLGDPSVIPQVLSALGCTEGRVRIPGQGHPFAMYHPLVLSSALPPTYFGLAFD